MGDFAAPDLFAAVVITPMGQRLTTPGLLEDGLWLLELLTFAMVRSDALPPEVVEATLEEIDALLTVGQRMLTDGGIGCPTEADHHPGDPVVVGSKAQRARLLDAIELAPDEVAATAPGGALGPFLGPRAVGRVNVLAPEFPIVEVAGRPIILKPQCLVHASLVHIWEVASKCGRLRELSELFAEATSLSVEHSLARLGLLSSAPVPEGLGLPSPGLQEAVYLMDADKVLHLQVAVDDLSAEDNGVLGLEWVSAPAGATLDDRASEVVSHCDEEVLGLVVVQSFARGFNVVVPPDAVGARLVLTAAELDVLSRHEQPDLLGLWRFATSIAELRKHNEIAPISQLEEYALYRRDGWSFLRLSHSLEGTSQRVEIRGFARDLRVGVALFHGRHGAPGPWDIGVVPVVRHEVIPHEMVFAEDVPVASGATAVLVEGSGVSAWFTGDERFERPEDWERVATVLNHLCFWYLQLSRGILAEPLEVVGRRGRPMEVMVGILDPGEEAMVQTAADPTVPRAAIALPFEWEDMDRLAVVSIVHVVCELADFEPDYVKRLTDEALLELSDHQHAFMIHGTEVALAPVGLPPRLALPWGHRRVRQRVGERIAGELGTELDGCSSGEVLARAVEIAFEDLRDLLTAVDGGALLELLVLNDEVLRHRQALSSRGAGMQAVAWGASVAKIRFLEEQAREQASAVATRFLIELVAAEPPTGLDRPSYSLVDEMLALGAAIIQWGMVGDLDRHEIDKVEVELVAGRELQEFAPRYTEAFEMFVDAAGTTTVARSRLEAILGNEDEPVDNDPFLEAALEQAFIDEVGVGFTDLLRIFAGLIDLGHEAEFGFVSLERRQIIESLVTETNLDSRLIASALDEFSLTPRTRYLDPPPGHQRWETWPWRFGRRLSLLYRPLIVSLDEPAMLSYGIRGVERTVEYLADALDHGTYRGRTQSMRAVMTVLQQARSDDFNDVVADRFESVHGAIVRRRYHKVGGTRLADDDGDVGDVDVLVVDVENRRVLAIEVKRYSGRMSPHQVQSELEMLVGAPGKPGVFDRHLRRTRLVTTLCDAVVADVGGPHGWAWRVEPLLVTDVPLVGRGLLEAPFPVLTIEEAIERFDLEEQVAR